MAMVSSKPLQRIPGITVLLMEWKSHESDEVNDEMANVLVAQILYLANQDRGVTDRGFQRAGDPTRGGREFFSRGYLKLDLDSFCMGGGNGGFQLRLHMMMFHQAGIVLGFGFGRNSEDAEAAGVLFTKTFSPNPNFRLLSPNLGHSGFPEMTLRHK